MSNYAIKGYEAEKDVIYPYSFNKIKTSQDIADGKIVIHTTDGTQHYIPLQLEKLIEEIDVSVLPSSNTNELPLKSSFSNNDRSMVDMQVDTYLKEIKDDLREREARVEKRFSDLAATNEQRDLVFRQEAREREERYIMESREREERFQKTLEEFKGQLKDSEMRVEKSIDELKADFKETKADNKSTKIAIWTLSLATIVSIAAMIVSILLTLKPQV